MFYYFGGRDVQVSATYKVLGHYDLKHMHIEVGRCLECHHVSSHPIVHAFVLSSPLYVSGTCHLLLINRIWQR